MIFSTELVQPNFAKINLSTYSDVTGSCDQEGASCQIVVTQSELEDF